MLYALQNIAIAVLLVVALAVVFVRLGMRRPSRMSRSLYTIAAVVLCLWLLGIVVAIVRTPGTS